MPAVAAAASVTGRCATHDDSAAAMPVRSRDDARAGHVVGQFAEVDAQPALVLLEDDERAGAGPLDDVQPEARVASDGSTASATSRRSATSIRGARSRWRRPAEPPPNRLSIR